MVNYINIKYLSIKELFFFSPEICLPKKVNGFYFFFHLTINE